MSAQKFRSWSVPFLSSVVQVRTVVDGSSTQHFIVALDVRIEELDKVKVVWCVLPLDEVFNLVLVSHIATTTDDRDWFNDGVDGGEQQTEV